MRSQLQRAPRSEAQPDLCLTTIPTWRAWVPLALTTPLLLPVQPLDSLRVGSYALSSHGGNGPSRGVVRASHGIGRAIGALGRHRTVTAVEKNASANVSRARCSFAA